MARRSRFRRRYSRPRFFRRRRSSGMTIPIAPLAGFAVVGIPAIQQAMTGQWEGAANRIIRGFTGYDIYSNDFSPGRLMEGALPVAVGLMVHKFVGGRPLNVNAALARAHVPFIRI